MKYFKALLLMVSLCTFPLFSEINWQTNFEEALAQAKREDKPLLLNFTGSDWCAWCMKLEENIFSTPEFEDEVGDTFIFVNVDFPAKKPQSEDLMIQNHALKKKYNIQGFPTLLLLDNSQFEITYTGYREESPTLYGQHLKESLVSFNELTNNMENFVPSALSSAELESLHRKALDLSREDYAEEILKAGLVRDDTLYFLGEQYRLIVENGDKDTPEAKTIRSKLLEGDPENTQGMQFYIAVIDYQDLSTTRGKSVDEIIAPLLHYLNKFGKQDKENKWRLHVTISQLYASKGKLDEALYHAKEAYEEAPTDLKDEIATSIDQMSFMQMSGKNV